MGSEYAPRQDSGTKTTDGGVAQFVIAAFDDWDALEAVIETIGIHSPTPWSAVLHARAGTDRPPTHSILLSEMRELHFVQSHQRVVCTVGQLAEQLAAGAARGARGLEDALGQWLNAHQARQLQHHIAHGRLVLWLELRNAEEFGAVCAHLVRASPHVVELGNIRFGRLNDTMG
jgi:hypothetical protein